MSDIVSLRSALIVVSLATAAVAFGCSNGSDYKSESVSSFHYVETITGTIGGQPIDSREEGYYRVPDSAHVIGDSSPSPLGLEQIVIGSQVWTRDASGWSASTTNSVCYTALDKAEFILRLGGEHKGLAEDDAATIAGEPTRLYTWTSDDAGRGFIVASELTLNDSASALEALALTREIYSNVTGMYEFVIGKNTGRLYSYKLTLEGPKLSQRVETVVDQYDEPVVIEPPEGVAPAGEAQGGAARCLGTGGDFPWIPAVAAAILGPVLFLVAAAFVWPRRPWMRG